MTAPSATSERTWPARLLWSLVGVGLLSWSLELVNQGSHYTWAAGAAVLVGGWGLLTVVLGLTASPRLPSRLANAYGWVTALVLVLAFLAWAAITAHAAPGYGTDELAFDQYAAQLVRAGMNPYTHTMLPALTEFRVNEGGFTHTLNGQLVTKLSYPALSFLADVPFLALGWSTQLGLGLDVLGWCVTVLLMFAMVPRRLRPAVLALSAFSVYLTLSTIGLTDLLFMPLLVVAAYRWDRFGTSRASYVAPAALGLALAAKQTPWPILLFVLAAIVADEQRRVDLRAGLRRGARYLATVVIAFALPNLPFFIMSPSAWIRGTLTPLTEHLVPGGQGIIGLTLFLHLGGGSLAAISALGVLVLLLLLVLYVGTYPLLRAATFVLPSVAYFFALRSYAIYLVALIPPAFIAATTAGGVETAAVRFIDRRWSWAAAAVAVLCVATGGFALADPAPLEMWITAVNVGSGGTNAQELTVKVTNHSGSTVSPSFALQTASSVTNFWQVQRGPSRLRGGQTAAYRLIAPDPSAQQLIATGLSLVAFTSSPSTVSVSHGYVPRIWRVGFDPAYLIRKLRIGRTITVHAQLLNSWNNPIHRAGVPVTVAQILGPDRSVASVNGATAGAPITATTNRTGSATFRIRAMRAGAYPAAFTATAPTGSGWGYRFVQTAGLTIRFAAAG